MLRFKILIILFIAMLSVSTSPIVARYLSNVPAVSISFWRMLIGAIVLWLISLFRNSSPMHYNDTKKTIIAGIFLGIHFGLFFGAIKLTTISNATFLGTLAPIVTFIIEKFIFKREHPSATIYGLSIAIIGAIIILSNNFNFSNQYTVGNILAVLCSICIGLAFIISQNVRKKVGVVIFSRLLFSSAAITLLIVAFFMEINLFGFTNFEWVGLIYLGIVPTILGHGFMYFAVRYVSPTIVSSIPMGEPIIASILAWFLFNEIADLSIYIGGFITLLGLIIIVNNKEIYK